LSKRFVLPLAWSGWRCKMF